MNYVQSRVTVDIVRAIDRNCGSRLQGACRDHRETSAAKSRRISANSKLKVQAHRLVRAAGVYTFHNSGCIYHGQKTAALGRARNSINSSPLVENGGASKVVVEVERGGIDTSEIYFWGKKSRANCYAIKSRTASRDSRNSRSFAFDLRRLNFTDRDVFVMVLLLFPIFCWFAKRRVNEGLISRQRSKMVYVALKFITSRRQQASNNLFPRECL